jgi:dienelactone hydrolase
MLKLIFSILTTIWLSSSVVSAGAHSQYLDYTVGNKQFRAFAVFPKTESKGNVYIIHDWNGLTDYEQKRAGMLADLGFTAIALDLFGVEAKLEGFDDYRRETGALYQNRDEFRTRIKTAINAASNALGVGSRNILIGYCFGGAAVLEAARAAMDLDGFVSFHGGLNTPEGQDYAQTKGSVLLLHGSADPVSGMVDLASLMNQLQEAGVEHDAEIYGGARHSFTVDGSRDYDASADQKSWQALTQFLEEI